MTAPDATGTAAALALYVIVRAAESYVRQPWPMILALMLVGAWIAFLVWYGRRR